MIYNVKDFGATGDGATNDTAAIQAAVDAAHAAGGGQVYIPAGTYVVSGDGNASDGAIMLYDNITVYGDGTGATTVKLQDGASSDITGIFRDQPGVENHDIGMHDLTIDGNRANTSGKVDGWFNGVSPGQPGTDTNITLNNVQIQNCSGYGFDPHEETTNLVITNCVSHGNGLDGFTLDFQINGHIDNNVAYDNDRHGFNIVTSSQGVELTGNVAYGNGADGIIVQRGSDNIPVPKNITITGGSYYDNGNDGIEISKAANVIVNGADIYGNAERGILIAGATGTIIENSTLHDDSASKNLSYEEIRIQQYDDTGGVSGQVYVTSNTEILNNTITDDGAVRASYAIAEIADGTDFTTVSNNTIYATGNDTPSLTGTHSTYTAPALFTGTVDPNAPTVLYAPLLGQSNPELFKLTALDGGSGLSHVEGGLAQLTDYAKVVSMTNMAVGDSTVDGDRHTNQDPTLVWWYPDQDKPGPALLNAVAQMQLQISELQAEGNNVAPIVIWGQGEAEANELGSPKSEAGREADEQEYINSTRQVFNYIEDHVSHNIQFYLMETGNFNTAGAQNFGYPQSTIDKENLGLTYVHDAQVKMADAWSDVHLAVNYSDLPMNADVPSTVPNYDPAWASDSWHLSLDSKEIAGDRLANFIALDQGATHILENPGPNYPHADLADLTIYGGPGVTVSGDANANIIAGTTSADTLSGGDGNDIIVGGGGGDTMTGGNGSDTFYYGPNELAQIGTVQAGTVADISDTITDFQTGAGGDVIDVSSLLKAAGYTGTDAVGAGYITITQQGADTIISFDQDGASGPNAAVAIARLANITASQFDTSNNLITIFPGGNPVTVNPNPSPQARDDHFSGLLGQGVIGNVLVDNGNGADTDPSNAALSTTAGTFHTAQGGSVVVDAVGNFTYAPALGFIGTDSFTYNVKDTLGAQDTGTVTIAVAAPAGALVGTNGDDILIGGSHNDVILGLNGNDTISGGSGNDTIYGGAGNDVLSGNSGDDTLYALSGNHTLNGNDGNDTLYAGAGTDILNGGDGNDLLIASTGAVTMSGGKGIDTYMLTTPGAPVATITDFSTVAGDKIDISHLLPAYDPSTQSISDFVHATPSGTDMMLSIDPDGAFNGANFTDVALLKGVQSFDIANLVTSGNLIVSTGSASDSQPPVAHNDTFLALVNQAVHGNVLLDNGSGPDTDPNGYALSVTLFSGSTANGGAVALNTDGTFTYTPLTGFVGSDSFGYTLLDGHGGVAHATVSISVGGAINGTDGNDTITGSGHDDVIHGLGGDDTISGGGGNDTIYGDAGNNILNGNAGNDTLYATSGNNVLHGNDDNDTLYAGSGTDLLYGDNGNDTLVAGTGSATLTGGGGADTFQFTGVSGVVDKIADFSSSIGDKIDIHSILQGYNPTTQAISDFVHATTQSGGTILSVDVDGAANGAHFTDLALLQGIGHFDVAAMVASGNLIVS